MHALSVSRSERAARYLQANKGRLLSGADVRFNGRVFRINKETRAIIYQWYEEMERNCAVWHRFGYYTPNWKINVI